MTERPTPAETEPPIDDVELVAEDDAIIGVAFRWSLVVIVGVGVLAGLIFLLRGGEEKTDDGPDGPDGPIVVDNLDQSTPERPAVTFTDVTAASGIAFTPINGATGEKLLPETMGCGVAIFDADGDGDQDLLFANARHWPGGEFAGTPPTPALYRNDGTGRFADATAEVGLDVSMYGSGVACGDYDNDGRVDVYLTALGENRLLRNTGDRFADVTAAAGVAGDPSAWSTSAGFFDYDDDGDLDLFVCNYVQWTRDTDIELNYTLNGTDRAYGPPTSYRGSHCVLYRNEGDGRFTDASDELGIRVTNPATGEPVAKALAVTFVDVDDDGRIDVLVANDTVQNFLFRNGADGFEEIGPVSGVAYSNMGAATGAMGIDAADFENAGRLGIGIGNFANESSSLYVQQPRDPWQFADLANAKGIGSPSRLKLSFGLFFFDYDLDGRLDVLQANGHLEDEINAIQSSQHYEQPAQLFWNCGPNAKTTYAAVPEAEMGDLATPIVGRGAAYGDLDGDGDLDVVLTQSGAPPLVLRNDQDLGASWIRLELVGSTCNRDAIGAWVEVTADGVMQRRQVMPTRSYLSQVERPLTFGLGDAKGVERVRVIWPDGSTQDVTDVPLATTTRIEQATAG